MNSVYDTYSIDRRVSRWEDNLFALTPVEKIGDIWFKREDKFAPLGFGSVNGSKLRQCLYLVNKWVKKERIKGVVSGSVVGSPQHPFISSICKHYGIGCLIVTGSKDYTKHKNMELAQQMGAKFYKANITYARALQSIAFKLKDKLPQHKVLETNITLDDRLNPAEDIEGFHNVGGFQTKNIPDHIKTLIIPCGSCNSVVSILYGIAKYKPKSLKKIILIGIGNNGSNNLNYIPKRLSIIESVAGIKINDNYNYTFGNKQGGAIEVIHYNPNGEKFCSYEDWMPFNYNGLELHPRYEGKCFNYFQSRKEEFSQYMNDTTMFWVVGNEPKYI